MLDDCLNLICLAVSASILSRLHVIFTDAVEIEYDDRHTAEGLKEVKEVVSKPNIGGSKSNGNGPGAEEDDEDDLDIDDI